MKCYGFNSSKKECMNCKYLDWCNRANVCNGECDKCDIYDCENNPEYKGDDENE